jgi:amino acid adenylation domain-containing protein
MTIAPDRATGQPPAPASFPADLPWRAGAAPRPAAVRHELPDRLARELPAVAARSGADLPTLLLAAVAVVVHRHTGEREVVLGAAGAERRRPAPVRLVVDASASFGALLAGTRDAVADADRTGSDGRGPVRVAVGGAEAAGCGLDAMYTMAGRELRLSYDGRRFSQPMAAWLLGHVATLLAEVVANPDRPLRSQRILAGPRDEPVPGSPAARPTSMSLVDGFRAVAARYPQAPAVTGPGGRYRYAELDRLTDALAGRLRPLAGPGDRLALLCDHDVGAVLGVLSALKTGAAYVPLDPRLPDRRLRQVVADARVAAVACDPALTARAGAIAPGRPVLPLAPPGDTAPAPGEAAREGAGLAYLLYTSGSTGTPKAVMQTRTNVAAHALAYAGSTGMRAGDVVPLLARFSFDAAVMDLFGALLTGACLHVLDPVRPAPALRAALGHAGATVVHATPTLFRHLVSDLGPAAGPVAEFATVRTVVLGGEEAGRQDLAAFLRAFPDGSVLVNGLGPTECTVALQHVAGRNDLAGTTLPVGYPVDGVRVRLLDADGAPAEVFGELEIISDRVAVGYWDRSDLTTARFVRYGDGSRAYRTGDLARRTPGGALVFCGRTDRQVKVRGHRVEPAEIEAALRAHPTVAQAAVIPDREPGAAVVRLVGFVTAATMHPPDPDHLLGFLRHQLPDYAVPARIVVLDEMPLGPTDKLDRGRLPVPRGAAADAGVDDAPAGPAERAVADIWRRVLRRDDIGRRSHFMASGGDSLHLVQMLALIRNELGVDVDLAQFLAQPTVAATAALTERRSGDGSTP